MSALGVLDIWLVHRLQVACSRGGIRSILPKSATVRLHRAWVLALRLAREPDRRTREKANMLAATDPPLSGEELLSAVTASMVALHERYYHRTPVTAKTQMLGDDLLAC